MKINSGKKQDEAVASFCLMLATPLPRSIIKLILGSSSHFKVRLHFNSEFYGADELVVCNALLALQLVRSSVIFVNENENENEKEQQFVHENEN